MPGATDCGDLAAARRRSSTIGRAGERSSAHSSPETSQSASGAALISANGFSSRRLRARSVATASSSRASQARW